MRTLIAGSKGQLGKDLVARFAQDGEVFGFDLPELDIADAGAVRAVVRETRPDVIINAAAYTNVDAAEDDAANAYRVNERGAECVAQAAAEAGVVVVYYSTDYVFGGAQTRPYVPGDAIAPIGVYAKSKAAGEAATRAATPRHFIVRTAWLYGPGGNSFVEKVLAAAASRPELKVVSDEIGSPTHTFDLAEATRALVKTEAHGSYHAVNSGSCSRFEFAKLVLELGKSETPMSPCSSSDFATKAERPLYSVLSTASLEAACGHQFPTWEDGLRHYMTRR